MARQPNKWAVGWIAFAAIMMIVMGMWWIISGIVAIANGDFYVVSADYILKLNVTAWGWIHLIIGIVVLIAGFGLFQAQPWARVTAVIIAIITALTGFAWMPVYPIWGVVYIAVSLFVIWALTVHGEDILV